MSKLNSITEGFGGPVFFETIEYVSVFEFDNITKGIGEIDFFDNTRFV